MSAPSSSGKGYDCGDNLKPNETAYTFADPNPPGLYTYSGWHANTGMVYINLLGIQQPIEFLAGTLAHEEQHQNGNDGPENTGLAVAAGITCRQM